MDHPTPASPIEPDEQDQVPQDSPTPEDSASDERGDISASQSEIQSGGGPASEADIEGADSGQSTASGLDNVTLEELEERADEEGVPLMELLLEEGDYLPEQYQRGDLVEGVVVGKSKSQLVINIGAKQEGVVPLTDLSRLPAGMLDGISVGDQIQGIVIRPENKEGEVVVSLFQAMALKDWDDATKLVDTGEILELEIVGYNKGGVLVGFGNLQGFVPRSHFAQAPRGGDGGAERLAEFVGLTIPVKVIEVSRRKRRLIMSERQAMRVWRSDRKKELLSELEEGEVRKGTVNSIADFGAFVDLGGADGLIHVSEMTYERGKHPRDVVTVGQEVEVLVLSIDRDRKRIGLSIKRLQKDPWQQAEENHYVGELVEGVISNVADFGAFAKLEDGLEGLVHVSELSDEHITHPSEVVRPGQRVTIEVISIDPERQRIGLSIRRVPEHLRTPLDEVEPGNEDSPESRGDPASEPDAGDEDGVEDAVEAQKDQDDDLDHDDHDDSDDSDDSDDDSDDSDDSDDDSDANRDDDNEDDDSDDDDSDGDLDDDDDSDDNESDDGVDDANEDDHNR